MSTKYEYKTVVGNVRIREKRADETVEQWLCAPDGELSIVDDPVPPDGDGWTLLATSFAPGTHLPRFVARDWRRPINEAPIMLE